MTGPEIQAVRVLDCLVGGADTAVLYPVVPSLRARTLRAIEAEGRRRGCEVFALYRPSRYGARIEAFLLDRENH